MKHVVFVPNGRLGNAIFRYFGCSLLCMKNNLGYVLEEDYRYEEDFTFYEGSDYVCHDLEFIRNNLDELKNYAKNNNKVLCFNTLGFLKNDFDNEKLVSNQWINKTNGHGLFVKNTLEVNDSLFFEFLGKNLKDFNLKATGYFQFDFIKYKKEIIDFMEKNKNNHYIRSHFGPKYLIKDIIDDIELENKYDVVIHIRLGDFKGRPDFIEYEYYEKVFEFIDFNNKKVCLMIENVKNEEEREYLNRCLGWFDSNNIKINIESNDVLIDFNIMKQCKTLVCSMSTLSWAAAFLSKHIEKCFMPNYNFMTLRPDAKFKIPIENTLYYEVLTTKIKRIKSFVITFREYPERIDNINKLFNDIDKIGMDRDIFYGVSGSDIKIDETKDEHIYKLFYDGKGFVYDDRIRINGIKMTMEMFGLLWSNYLLYKKLLEDKENDYYFILEDNVEFIGNLKYLYEHLTNLPDVDIINMGISDNFPFILEEKIDNYYHKVGRRYFNRTTAIIISKKCARKMIDELEIGMNVPLDDMYCYYYLRNNDFRYVVPERNLFQRR